MARGGEQASLVALRYTLQPYYTLILGYPNLQSDD